MASRLQFKYELAQIEIEERQLQLEERKLQLERKKLRVKQHLAQLNTVDLTEDNALTKAGSDYGSTDNSRRSTRNTFFSEPLGNAAPSSLAANSANVGEEEMTLPDTFKKSTQPTTSANFTAFGESPSPLVSCPQLTPC